MMFPPSLSSIPFDIAVVQRIAREVVDFHVCVPRGLTACECACVNWVDVSAS